MTPIDVPARVVYATREPRAVDRAALVRRMEAAGWQVVSGEEHDLLRAPSGGPVVALPHAATEIAPGVSRVMLAAVADAIAPRAEAAEVLARLDALFARNPHDGDATRLIREQRDAG